MWRKYVDMGGKPKIDKKQQWQTCHEHFRRTLEQKMLKPAQYSQVPGCNLK